MVDPVDYSQTQRIVLLIDLQPLLRLQNPSPYLTTIFAAARNLVAFRPLSSCLFAFKFFFSSLSPLLSSSAVHRLVHKPSSAAASLSFDHPSETLSSLSRTLDSLSSSPVSSESATSPPRAAHVAGSLLQLVHDYSWESQNENLSGRVSNFPNVRPNLVLLLLPLDCVSNSLSEFMNVGVDNELLSNADLFCKNFQNFFGSVSDAYVSRDIHCTWVGVKFIVGDNGDKIETDETLSQLGFLKDGIRSLGWGFCSTDSIILGSALIPFQLIYPMMGISFSCLNCNYSKSFHAQLTLEISDVMGRPLECKCCDLEMLDLKKPSKLMTAEIMHTLDFRNTESEALKQVDRFWEYLGEGVIKIHIRAVQKCKEDMRIESCSSNLILVRGGSGELGRSMKKKLSTFFADRVLKILLSEMGELIHGKIFPIWQILLCFLCRKDYVAVVSLSRGNGNCLTGILKPFTAHSGLLYIVDEDIWKNLIKVDEFLKPYSHNISTGSVSSQLGILSSLNNESLGDQNRKKNKKVAYQNLTWFSFHKAAFECSVLELEEVYLASKYNDSKKLKFFKCWMKQIEKSNYGCLPVPNESRSCQYVERDIDERLIGAHDESEQPIASYFCSGSSNIHEGAAFVSCSETSESFFSNLPRKIQDGIESKGVDLQILAERLVNLSIYWLYQKNDADNSLESETPTGNSDTCCGKAVASSIIKLLLKEPKQLKEGPKDADESFPASDPGSANLTSAETVREHELQILLRMEILRSMVGEGVEASTKRKLVKEICMLLEIIQYLVEGGLHGHLSLYDYVEKTIKIRYSHVLCEVVHKIYRKMDLLPYGDENESLIRLLNSEDSNHSWREKDRYEAAETNRIHESTSAENESLQSLEHNQDSPLDVNKEEHARRLTEAQERRERARRFVSFTTWVPDLQRVWAPKQPKAARAKSELSQKQPKRKARHRGNHDVVCETPMMVKNHNGSNPSVSVSKALFQDDR
ncbi:LOW QUALITY PROTEIN: uncharacterized protein LOC127796767 [Diospyros lotus]|uniref:LOW QUALITY PROTEIN: uncharacterized protein LOC127796767 n=1 Tax=Diospyros lotus TaxID=55363 RepID=UPI002254D34F|nr:LOW QUALITY PROTEIN: uncharacterized protein LOC127796767 [Diospyros lotus]